MLKTPSYEWIRYDEDDYHINYEARTVDYNGNTYSVDPETITLTDYEGEVKFR